MLAFALTWKPRLRGMSARRRSMTLSCLSAATSAGMVPRIAFFEKKRGRESRNLLCLLYHSNVHYTYGFISSS